MLACLAIVVSTPHAGNQLPSREKDAGCGVESPPFVMKTDQGFTRFAIDLWGESAKRMGLLRISGSIDSPRASQFSHHGKIRCCGHQVDHNAERMERIDFSQPWFDAACR